MASAPGTRAGRHRPLGRLMPPRCYHIGQMTNSEPGAPAGRGRATRQRISAAAVELVAELGWDAVTTRAVAARAGVNPALVHYHFGSMDVLLRSAVVAALDEEIGQAARPFADDPTLGGALGGAFDAVSRFDPRAPAATLLIEAMVRAVRDPGLTDAIVGGLQGFRGLVAARIRVASRTGEAPADLPAEATGALVAAALDGLLFHRIVDPATDVAGVRDVLLRLVTQPAGSAQGGAS
jgi:AcrR family transcriptional regulator